MKGIISVLVFASCCVAIYGVNLGATCSTASECTTTTTNSHCAKYSGCTKGQCTCVAGYRSPGSGTLTCVKTVYNELGESCSTSSDCNPTIAGIYCSASVCSCRSSSGYIKDGNKCKYIKSLALTATCTNSYDCAAYQVGGGYCSTTCKCSTGYKEVSGGCTKATNGETCSSTGTIVGCKSPLTCSTTCKCATGYTYTASACVGTGATEAAKGAVCDANLYPGATIAASKKYCLNALNIGCTGCPENASDKRCRSDATTTFVVPTMLYLSVLATICGLF